jgi:hypothetical protein
MKKYFTILIISTAIFNSYPQDTIHVPEDYSTIQTGINALDME